MPRTIIDTDTANILNLLGAQSNPQLNIKIKNVSNREYEMNGFDITLELNAS